MYTWLIQLVNGGNGGEITRYSFILDRGPVYRNSPQETFSIPYGLYCILDYESKPLFLINPIIAHSKSYIHNRQIIFNTSGYTLHEYAMTSDRMSGRKTSVTTITTCNGHIETASGTLMTRMFYRQEMHPQRSDSI